MKKLLAILLMCLTCVTAFAEGDASGAVELLPCIGTTAWADARPLIPDPFMKGSAGRTGMTMYLGDSYDACVTVIYARDGAAESFGWGAGTVHYVSLSKTGYTLGGIGVGDAFAELEAVCAADGWVRLETAGENLDGAWEKIADGVRYTLSYILESGTERVSFVCVQAEKLPL